MFFFFVNRCRKKGNFNVHHETKQWKRFVQLSLVTRFISESFHTPVHWMMGWKYDSKRIGQRGFTVLSSAAQAWRSTSWEEDGEGTKREGESERDGRKEKERGRHERREREMEKEEWRKRCMKAEREIERQRDKGEGWEREGGWKMERERVQKEGRDERGRGIEGEDWNYVSGQRLAVVPGIIKWWNVCSFSPFFFLRTRTIS